MNSEWASRAMPAADGYAIARITSVIAPATNEAIAYSTQKVMRLLSDSSSLMLFFLLSVALSVTLWLLKSCSQK